MRLKALLPLEYWIVLFLALVPAFEAMFSGSSQWTASLRPILIFAFLGLGLNVVTGFTGLLNLGVAAFMAIGAYSYAIATCDIYPFQLGFWPALGIAILAGTLAGVVLGLPTLRLSGDYLAVVTMGFGEIVQDLLRNLDSITKGTQGINPLPAPQVPLVTFSTDNPVPWFYLYLFLLILAVIFNRNFLYSRIGRACSAVREDELAASCMGVRVVKTKLMAFATGAALCSIAGALWATHLGSTGEPGNYDFQVSVIALCIVIVGGLGSIPGVLIGSFIMVGFNSLLLTRLSDWLGASTGGVQSVYANPNNWKYMVFGLALILMMRYRPQGLVLRDARK